MQLTPELIVAISAAAVSILGAIAQFRARSTTASKNALASLRQSLCGEIERLNARIQQQDCRIDELTDDLAREHRNRATLLEYIARLRSILIEHNIAVPEMPILEKEDEQKNRYPLKRKE